MERVKDKTMANKLERMPMQLGGLNLKWVISKCAMDCKKDHDHWVEDTLIIEDTKRAYHITERMLRQVTERGG